MALILLVALSVGVGASNNYTTTWVDPNGVNQEVYLGSEAEWVFVTVDGETVWMSWEMARDLSKQLKHAAQSAQEFDNRFIEKGR